MPHPTLQRFDRAEVAASTGLAAPARGKRSPRVQFPSPFFGREIEITTGVPGSRSLPRRRGDHALGHDRRRDLIRTKVEVGQWP
jgi:hypothetical protein